MPDHPQVIYIASLSHSGSTLLHHLVSAHAKCIGIGEALRTIEAGPMGLERSMDRTCSCGNSIEHCEYWGRVLERMRDSAETKAGYQHLLPAFQEAFGADKALVDASKYVQPLDQLRQTDGVKIKVLFLIKDVRAYTISQIDNANRKIVNQSKPGMSRQSAWKHFRFWRSENEALKRYIKQAGLDWMQLSYEELCLFPNETIAKICEFLELEPDPDMITLQSSEHHLIRGNQSVVAQQATKGGESGMYLRYDHRWFYRREWLLPSLFCRSIMEFNRQQVYSNDMENVLGRFRGASNTTPGSQ